mgnify:CR=1 FL=1
MKELANPQAAGLQVFYNESENVSIRTTMIDGEPWFVAKDVCMLLDLSNPRDILAKVLDDDEKGVDTIYTLGGRQQMSIINESGLYHLIFVSRKPEAKAIRRWVTGTVLPSIRRTGSYTAGSQPEERTRLPLPRFRAYFKEWKESLTPYIRRKELVLVAETEEVTLTHVMKVWAGTSVSRKVASGITTMARLNRRDGIIYPKEKPVYEQLMIQWENEQ